MGAALAAVDTGSSSPAVDDADVVIISGCSDDGPELGDSASLASLGGAGVLLAELVDCDLFAGLLPPPPACCLLRLLFSLPSPPWLLRIFSFLSSGRLSSVNVGSLVEGRVERKKKDFPGDR